MIKLPNKNGWPLAIRGPLFWTLTASMIHVLGLTITFYASSKEAIIDMDLPTATNRTLEALGGNNPIVIVTGPCGMRVSSCTGTLIPVSCDDLPAMYECWVSLGLEEPVAVYADPKIGYESVSSIIEKLKACGVREVLFMAKPKLPE